MHGHTHTALQEQTKSLLPPTKLHDGLSRWEIHTIHHGAQIMKCYMNEICFQDFKPTRLMITKSKIV